MQTADHIHQYLSRKLLVQKPEMLKHGKYLTGTQPTPYLDPEVERVTGGRIVPLSVNFARVVVEVIASRLTVTGFSTTPGASADADLWALWQANDLDEVSLMAHEDALTYGRAFYMAWVGPDGQPCITAESPLMCSVARDPLTGYITSALKRYMGADGYSRSILFLPDRIVHYISKSATTMDPYFGSQPVTNLTTFEDVVVERIEDNPLGVVPWVALVNRPRLQYPDGSSELEDIEPLVDAIAQLSSNMMQTSDYSASPRRYVTGLVTGGATTEEQAEDIAQRIREKWEKAHASKFLVAPGADTRFGQFDSASLSNFESAIGMLTAQIASLSGLPPTYLSFNTANPVSADAYRASEARLTKKAEQKQRQFSGPYEDLMRLAVLIRDGQQPQELQDMQTLWASAAPSTLAQTSDAVTKTFGAGLITRKAALIELGYSAQDIATMGEEIEGADVIADADLVETDKKVTILTRLVQSGYDPADALRVLNLPPIKHTGLPSAQLQMTAFIDPENPASAYPVA
jgi:hypothetical protein